MFVDVLPRWERYFYWIVGISGIVYSIYSLFLEGERYSEHLENELSPGWSWLGRHRDQSDFEWFIWSSTLLKIIFLNAIHMLLSQICFFLNASVKIHSCVLLIFDLVAAYVYTELITVLILIAWTLIMYAASLSGSKFLVWLIALSLILSLDSQIDYLEFYNFQVKFLSIPISVIFYIRLTSFALDKIQYRRYQTMLTSYRKSQTCTEMKKLEQIEGLKASDSSVCDRRKECMTNICHLKNTDNESCDSSSPYKITNTKSNVEDSDPSFLDLLFYSFYLPTFIYGPILIYHDFDKQVKTAFRSSSFTPDVYDIIKQLIWLSFWAVFIEFQFHFLYYGILSFHPELIQILPVWAVASIGYCKGQLEMIKYCVMYGSAIQFSRFDGAVPLARPRCISWVYSYTQMWKLFDVGLYNFIKIYIYIPVGGSSAGIPRKIFASGLAYLFIYCWHGASKELLVWCVGNCLIGILENAALLPEESAIGVKLKSYLGPAVCLRVKVLIISPVYVASALLMFYFFFKGKIGDIFVSRILTKASWTEFLTLFVILTACIHNAIYLTQWYTHKMTFANEQKKKR